MPLQSAANFFVWTTNGKLFLIEETLLEAKFTVCLARETTGEFESLKTEYTKHTSGHLTN
ncbi:unnamed protein product [Acanthoscelides obtectus]|uniref:Uncharacterized protein n=1 Tax=Acanthoscelides obtectus TaxID=200917 RepID=A0A9P0L411_ACAOB|nr:unnamed protein product [Acanthoscelides obtectus]CAK1668691.1 hypothetical protein AOBTE_LOCUS26538 [Acanthoscelides obtectus]